MRAMPVERPRQAQGAAASAADAADSAAGHCQVSLPLYRALSGHAAESRVQLALSVVVVGQESAAVDGAGGVWSRDLEMDVLEHGAAHGALVADVLPRGDRVSDFEMGFARHRAAGHVGVVRPLAVGMRDPDIVVVTERRSAP